MKGKAVYILQTFTDRETSYAYIYRCKGLMLLAKLQTGRFPAIKHFSIIGLGTKRQHSPRMTIEGKEVYFLTQQPIVYINCKRLLETNYAYISAGVMLLAELQTGRFPAI